MAIQNVIAQNGKHTVNKELALAILAETDNTYNREFIPKLVKSYAKQMSDNVWSYNGDPIRVTTTSKLVDGQHRLTAIVESDTVQELYFIIDLEDETDGIKVFEVIDQHSRKPYEVLKIANPTIKNPKEMVNLMQQLEVFNTRKFDKKPNGYALTNKELVTFAEDFIPLSTLDNFIERGLNLALRSKLLNKKEWILLASTINQLERGAEFLETLASYSYEDDLVFDKDGFSIEFTNPLANLMFNLNRTYANKLKLDKRYASIFNAYQLFLADVEASPKKLGAMKFIYPTDYANYDRESN